MQLIDYFFVAGLFALALCIIAEPWITNYFARKAMIFVVGYICFSGILVISYHIAKAMVNL